jgi:hypothetical protein
MQNNLHADPHNSTPAIAPTRAGSMLKKDFFKENADVITKY